MKKTSVKLISFFMSVLLLVTAISVPVTFGAAADGEPIVTVYDFEENPPEEGLYYGNSLALRKAEGKGVLMGIEPGWKREWGTADAMRVNKAGETYKLKAGTTYMVSMDVKSIQSIQSGSVAVPMTARATYRIGYDITDGPTGDPRMKMGTPLYTFMTYGVNCFEYTADGMFGTRTFPIGSDVPYHNQTYVFTAPEDAEGKELGIYGANYYGGYMYMDTLTVTELPADYGVVAAINSLTDEEVFYYGKKGETVPLENFEAYEGREFVGWYESDLETPVSEIKFGDEVTAVYGVFGGNAVYTFDVLGMTEKKSGAEGDAVVLPEVPEFSGDSKFIGWFLDEAHTVPFTDTTFGIKNKKIYSFYSPKVTITCNDVYSNKKYQVTGYPGEEYKFPDPRDPKHDRADPACRLFVGWYTDSNYTSLYETVYGNKFPNTSGVTVYSKWIESVSYEEDCEKYALGPNLQGAAVTRVSNVGVDGSKALRYNSDEDLSTAQYGTAREWKEGFFRIFDLSKATGFSYKLSFKYKVVSTDCDFQFVVASGTSFNNFWEYPHTFYTINIPADAKVGEWITVEDVPFTIEPWYDSSNNGHTPQAIYGRFVNPNGGSFEMLVDDFKLTATTSPIETLAVLYPMNDDMYDTDGTPIRDVNYIDEPIAFPKDLTFGDRKFLGWATDRYGNNIVTTDIKGGDLLHGKQNIYLWAIWDRSGDPDPSTMVTFENYSGTQQSLVFNYNLLEINGENPYRGYKACKLKYDATTTAVKSPSGIDNCMRLLNVEDGYTYKVTFKYNAVKANTNISLKFATGSEGNIWDAVRTLYPGAYTIPKGTEPGWKEGTFYFHSKINHRTLDNGTEFYGPALFAYFNMDSADGAEVYFDDFIITKVDADVIVSFDDGKSGGGSSAGKPGDPIVFPTPTAPRGKMFAYWAYDEAGANKFDATVIPDADLTVYAIYEPSDEITFTYEDYTYKSQFPGCDMQVVEFGGNGNKCVKLDRTPDYGDGSDGTLNYSGAAFPLADSKVFNIVSGYNYIIKFKYYIEKQASGNGKVFPCSAHTENYWHQMLNNTSYFNLSSTDPVGQWIEGAVAFDMDLNNSKNVPSQRGIYLRVQNFKDGIVYFDDVTLIKVPKGYSGVAINQGGYSGVPLYVFAKIGSDFKSLIPANYKRPGYKFEGYYKGANLLDDYTADPLGLNIEAHWNEANISQGFEEEYLKCFNSRIDYAVADFDYEVYDSAASGNSKANVTGGRYSLHRKGESMYFENACLLNSGRLSSDGRYTVSFKVKMDSYKHTDGAIKIASNRSSRYPWHTSGDYYAVVPIADLTDGEWHTVSYTFNSVEAYATIQTPGYCSIYIDDVNFALVDNDTPLSENCNYIEYVVAKRDEQGNVLSESAASEIDIDSIIDASLTGRTSGGKTEKGGFNPLYVIIPAAVLVVAAGVAVFFIIKKKKKGAL